MEQKTRNAFWLAAAALLIVMPAPAEAACSNPYGEAGDMVYNGDHDMMQFCDDTDWIAMGGGGGGGGFTDKITDADDDTMVQVEESADEDNIRFDTAGTERMVLDENGVLYLTGVAGGPGVGGGGGTPSGIAGAVQFSDGTAFASDAANFFWNDTTNRFGIGTNVPTEALEVAGTTKSIVNAANKWAGWFENQGTGGVGNSGCNSTFGTHLTAYGGGFGMEGSGGSGGGPMGAGPNANNANYFKGGEPKIVYDYDSGFTHYNYQGGACGADHIAPPSLYHGGGGSIGGCAAGSSQYGGGGGGGYTVPGGTSLYAGNGGAGGPSNGVAASPGTQPGGGGGGAYNANGANGAAGRCRVTVF